MKFTVEKFYKRASSPSVANDYLPPSMISVSEPAIVDEGSESEHLPEEEILPVTPDHLPEAEEAVAPVETDSPEHLLESEPEEEESVDPETDLSDICTDVQCEGGDERFRGRLKLDHQTGSLTIMNIRTTDSGLYTLMIISSNSDSEKIFKVTVIESSSSSCWFVFQVFLLLDYVK
ncbi:hypothetical protein cypCar_00047240 [Cyprinus carpio]|nr:hypothetical protein cypCar_00047240 [Cyprinus carpio]